MPRKSLRKGPGSGPPNPRPLECRSRVNFRILADIGGVMTAEMTVEAWIALPNHPHQRNTAATRGPHLKQAKQAAGAVARQAGPRRRRVSTGCTTKWMATPEVICGSRANCRARPFCTSRFIRSRPERRLDALYEVFDASTAAKTRYDQVYGASGSAGSSPDPSASSTAF